MIVRLSHLRGWAILGLFCCLTLVMLYPLSIQLTSMVPEPTDPLLNVWRMQWNGRAFLGGPKAISNLFNTNIFYPFPLTLAYSEHFLMIAAEALPFLLVADSHLLGMNLMVLVTFVLSGYGMYLLITGWTGSRWAGLLAGILFAFSPHRFGQLNHLELLVTEWMPFTLLALHWTLTRSGLRYAVLFGIFFNLQILSGFHYGLNLTIACAMMALVYTLSGKTFWRRGLWGAAALSILVTFLLNWPIWRMYLRFSDVMGAVRTPGEVRVYSAALTDYVTAIPYNFLYGWTFGNWSTADHQIQPLMPFGLMGLFLTLIALAAAGYALMANRHPSKGQGAQRDARSNIKRYWLTAIRYPSDRLSKTFFPTAIFSLLLIFFGLLLSFGLNENALGSGLASVLKYSPYVWLYENVMIFQGIRVPGRYGILVVIGLVGLAGWGAATLFQVIRRSSQRLEPGLTVLLAGVILLEAWSAPLIGPEFPAGQDIPPVYRWLRHSTAPEAVVLELPFQDASEFAYEYYASYHWRRIANGGTGFTPPIYKELRRWWQAFPDPRSMDIIQQMGIEYVILHRELYRPEEWQRILDDLPRYLPAIEQIYQFNEALVLHIVNPFCRPEMERIAVTLSPAELDGLGNAVSVAFHNSSPAALVADVQQMSALTFENESQKRFIEPLVTPAGETQSIIVPLPNSQQSTNLSLASLATLNRQVSFSAPPDAVHTPDMIPKQLQWQPLGLKFADGPELAAFALNPETLTVCSQLTVVLDWKGGNPSDKAMVQLLDPFNRVIAANEAQPWHNNGQNRPDVRVIPLNGALPPGRYGLRVMIKDANGQERLPVTDAGVTIPTDQIPPLLVEIDPVPPAAQPERAASVLFGDMIELLGVNVPRTQVSAGDWLRFSLIWQIDQPIDLDLTVFTQLLGPDGQVWGQRDNRPGGGWYDMALWQPDQPVVDDYAFQTQADAPPGSYRLIAGLYHSPTLERIRLADGSDFVEIALIQLDHPVDDE